MTPYVFTTHERAAGYLHKPPDLCSYFLVQLQPRADAAEVRDALRRDTEFAIINGSGRGCLWSEHDWLPIRMPRDRVVRDVDIGSVFCAAYALARHVFEAGSRRACSYALDVIVALMKSAPVPSYVR